MTGDVLICNQRARRERIRAHGLNGLDELEVSDDQRTLTVTFLAKAPDEIDACNVRIDAPAGALAVHVTGVRLCRQDDPDRDDCMRVSVDHPGDFSCYTLRVVEADDGRPGDTPLSGVDARYAAIDFSFKAACPSDEDCLSGCDCPPPAPDEPAISYLAKDYDSLRQLILDRLALITPDWHERHVADLAVTLVELLAYVGDTLSYYQDAVATEAYLETARRRISVRRHVRLVDYPMHDGCNARAWVCIEVSENITLRPDEICLLTRQTAGGPVVSWQDVDDDVRHGVLQAYELIDAHPVDLHADHNRIALWTWGDSECCLQRGATTATLTDRYTDDDAPPPPSDGGASKGPPPPPPDGDASHGPPPPPPPGCDPPPPATRPRALDALKPGDVFILEEVIGPATGNRADADPDHRQAVRLTDVTRTIDELYNQPVVEVRWEPDDALTFTLCLSTIGGPDCVPIADVSVARGNVVLVDHGASTTRCGADPETLPPREERRRSAACDGPCDPADTQIIPAPYTPALAHTLVTRCAAFPDPQTLAARQAQRIAGLERAALDHLDELIDALRTGGSLTADDLRWLVALLGAHAVRAAGLRHPRPRRGQSARVELEAVENLAAQAAHMLQRKARRTATLATRARGGQPLSDDGREQLIEMWGSAAADRAAPDGQALWGPASGALQQDPCQALAALTLTEHSDDGPDRHWNVRADLLASGPADRDVVVEVDDDGVALLRFGDGRLGRSPAPATKLTARYRVGNGSAGNVAAETIGLLASCTDTPLPITRLRNPLPAAGGSDPEPLDVVRLVAPDAFRAILRRAITAEDYATLAAADPAVQRAVARLRWTGSWYEALVGIDARTTGNPSAALLDRISARMAPLRRIGHDLRVAAAQQVPLDLALEICASPDFQRGHVLHAVRGALGSHQLPDGSRGMFHPDELTFGTTIAVSAIIARVRAVPGVQTARVTTLRRLFDPPPARPAAGVTPPPPAPVLRLGPLEVAVLDANRAAPDRGRLTIDLRGGR